MKVTTMERALKRYPNRFELTMLAASRAKGLNSGDDPAIAMSFPTKPVVLALEEIADGLVVPATLEEMEKIREAMRAAREEKLLAIREAEAAQQAAQTEVEGDASEDLDAEK